MVDTTDRWLLPETMQDAPRVFRPLNHLGLAVTWGPERVVLRPAAGKDLTFTPDEAELLGAVLIEQAQAARLTAHLRVEYEQWQAFIARLEPKID